MILKKIIIYILELNENLRLIFFKNYIIHNFFSIYKSCVWIMFFQGMVIEMVFNNEIQIFLF